MEEENKTQKKILIVEDDEDLRELYLEILRDSGFSVLEAVDGAAGLEKALAGGYDLLLLDIMLPKVDGLEILRQLKQRPAFQTLPVILLTNLGRDTFIKDGFALGAAAYLIKSALTPNQVVDEVRKFI